MLVPSREKVIFHFQNENGTISDMFSHFDEEDNFCTDCSDWKDKKNGIANYQALLVRRHAEPAIYFSSPYIPLLLPTQIKLS